MFLADSVQFAFIPAVLITRTRRRGQRDLKQMQSTFDPVGIATDWLDAYRAKNVDAIVALYADNAIIECRCDGQKTITGSAALKAYWQGRCAEKPALGLEDLQLLDGAVVVSYLTDDGVVQASLNFDESGKIKFCRCRPVDAKR
jgi:hypothetical protein